MEPSLFIDLVEKYFPGLVLSTTETINGVDAATNSKPYYFMRFLGRKFSLSGRWEALSYSGSRVMADVIAMDSSIPLKKRPALSAAAGEIPKLGMEMALNETDLTNLQMMASSSIVDEDQLLEILLSDTVACIVGQYERIEHMFLEGLSSGAVVVAKGPNAETSAGNVGTEIRLDFQYPAENQADAAIPWGQAGYTPVTDLANLTQKASTTNRPIRTFLMDRASADLLLASDEAKDLYAQANNIIQGVTFAPSEEQFNAAARSRFGFDIEVIVRTTQYQIDGVDYNVQPWTKGQVIGINNERLGDLVWSFLAEMNAPVAGVVYQRADQFILASKYRVNRPSLAEFTSSQSRAVPVIADVKQIYKLDTKAA